MTPDDYTMNQILGELRTIRRALVGGPTPVQVDEPAGVTQARTMDAEYHALSKRALDALVMQRNATL